MKIWIVYSQFYTDTYIDGAFSTVEKAEAFIEGKGEFKNNYRMKLLVVE